MRRILMIVVCCLTVSGLAVVAGASTTPTKAPTKSQSAKTTVHKVKQERLWGKVIAVNAKAMTITVHTKWKGDQTITLNSQTMLHEGKAKVKFDKVKIGDHVGVTYVMAGQSMVATAVHVRVERAKAPKAKAKSGK